jgi:carboxypeptidase T
MENQSTVHIPSLLLIISVFLLLGPVQVGGHSSYPLQQQLLSLDSYQYHTYQTMTDLLFHLYENHSDIMSLWAIGTTYEGRTIWMVKLSDHPERNEDEPGVLLMGAHHGNEKPSYESLLYFIQLVVDHYGEENRDNDGDGMINEDIIDGRDNDGDGLIDEDLSEERITTIVDQTQIFIIPMVNPDGVEANTRKNCAPNYGRYGLRNTITSYGVDLNRNYEYKWYLYYVFPLSYHQAITSMDASWNYRGPYPFSENETRAVKYVADSQDISISLSYHSYGEFLFYPWTHTSIPVPEKSLFASIGENISAIDGYYLYKGNTYLIPRFGGTLGTSENWLYARHGILSFTIELCQTRAPVDPQIVEQYCRNHAGVDLYVCERSWTINQEKIQ